MIDEKENQQVKELEYRLDELRKQILEASIHFNICEDLWPTEEKVNVINRYIGFFQPSRIAHFNRFTILISNIFSTTQKAPSFYNIFKILRNSPQLAPGKDISSLSKRLRQHKKTKEAINDFRNRRAAHYDAAWPKEEPQRKPILFGDTKKMLKDMQEIFNEISGAHSHNIWSFEPLQHDHTNYVLNELESYHKIKRLP